MKERLTIEECLAIACRVTGQSERDLREHRHTRTTVRARWLAWWLARKFTTASYPEIGRFCGYDHTTVIHGVKRFGSSYSEQGWAFDMVRGAYAEIFPAQPEQPEQEAS